MANIRKAGRRVNAYKESDYGNLEQLRRSYLKKAARKYGRRRVAKILRRSLRNNPSEVATIKRDLKWLGVSKAPRRNPFSRRKTCDHCLGAGLVFDGICPVCIGDGSVKARRNPRRNPCGICSLKPMRRNPISGCGACSLPLRRNPFYNPLEENPNYNGFSDKELNKAIYARRNPSRFWR